MKTLYKLASGAVVADIAALDVFPFDLLTNAPDNAVTIPANGQAGPYIMTISKEGPIVIQKLCAQRTGVCKILLVAKQNEKEQPLMNAACHIDTIFGSGQQPYFLPQELFLPENHEIRASFSDLSGSSNVVRLLAGGYRLRKGVPDPNGDKQRARELGLDLISYPFFYTQDAGPAVMTALGTATSTFSIGTDGHFEVHTIAVSATSSLFNIDLYNQSTGESIINAPAETHYEVPSTLLGGSNNFPFKLHEPWLIDAGQKLVATMTDTSNAANTVFITLGGVYIRKAVK